MKFALLMIIVALLLLLAGCEAQTNQRGYAETEYAVEAGDIEGAHDIGDADEADHATDAQELGYPDEDDNANDDEQIIITDPGLSPEDFYTIEEGFATGEHRFPADMKDLAWVMFMSRLNWGFEIESVWLEDLSATHVISNPEGTITVEILQETCELQDARTIYAKVHYVGSKSRSDYVQFINEEWPLIWSVMGILMDAQEETTVIGEESMRYLILRWGHEQDELRWRGRQGDISAEVILTWHEEFEIYTPGAVRLTNQHVYDYEDDYGYIAYDDAYNYENENEYSSYAEEYDNEDHDGVGDGHENDSDENENEDE